MANRTFASGLRLGSDKDVVHLFAVVAFNAASTPSLLKCDLLTGKYTVAPSAGTAFFSSFTRASTGNYTLTLKDTYIRLLRCTPTFISNTSAAAPIYQVKVASDPTVVQAFGSAVGSGTVRSGTSSINLLTFSAATTAADPAATEIATIEIVLQNSVGN